MSDILVVGDLHGEFDRLNQLISRERPEIILQCGDLGFWPRLGEPGPGQVLDPGSTIYFCEGNIDDIEELQRLSAEGRKPVAIGPSLYYMPRGTVLTLADGRRILFMGGALSRDRHQRTPGLDWFPGEILVPGDLEALPDLPIDIVISHTCPREFALQQYKLSCKAETDPSQECLSEILARYKPPLWYFGHWHFGARGQYENTRWTALSWYKEREAWFTGLPAKLSE